MKHYVPKVIPLEVKSVLDHRTCDLCGVVITDGDNEVNEVFVYSRQGFSYSDCGWGTETSFDVCSKCFTDTLVPFMTSKGAKPTVDNWDL
jgi:hypothetical protein